MPAIPSEPAEPASSGGTDSAPRSGPPNIGEACGSDSSFSMRREEDVIENDMAVESPTSDQVLGWSIGASSTVEESGLSPMELASPLVGDGSLRASGSGWGRGENLNRYILPPPASVVQVNGNMAWVQGQNIGLEHVVPEEPWGPLTLTVMGSMDGVGVDEENDNPSGGGSGFSEREVSGPTRIDAVGARGGFGSGSGLSGGFGYGEAENRLELERSVVICAGYEMEEVKKEEEDNMGVALLGPAIGIDGPQGFQDVAAAVDECDSDDHEDPYRHIDIDPGDEDHIGEDEDRSNFGMDVFDDNIGFMVNVDADEKLTEIDELELEYSEAHREPEEREKFGKRKRLKEEDDDGDLRRPNKYAKTASERPTRASTTTRRGAIGRAGVSLPYKRTPSDDMFAASPSSTAFGSASASSAALESISPSTSAAATASTSFPSTTATATASTFNPTSAGTSTATTTTASPSKRRKRSEIRKGWKGWVEVDGDEERFPPKQFRLEIFPPGVRRTRSGRQFGS